jgi:DNA-binding NarL/FixJ family response regulator
MNYMRRALIIEDDNKFRILLRRLLEKKFHIEVFEAEDGLEGLESFKQTSPRLIFLDVSMPNMDGVECLTKIREIDATTPVVVLTCMSNKSCVQKMVELGISDYIVKTDFVLALSERIYDILEKNRIFAATGNTQVS